MDVNVKSRCTGGSASPTRTTMDGGVGHSTETEGNEDEDQQREVVSGNARKDAEDGDGNEGGDPEVIVISDGE